MSTSSYQPFLIGSGQSKTGMFQYLQSWVAPEDAFDDLEDAYINRGVINKRDGQVLLGTLQYSNSQVLTYGNGTTGLYSGSFATNTPQGGHWPIIPGSVTIMTREGTTNVTYFDDGVGNIRTSLPSGAIVGSLNYTTGGWSITTTNDVNNGSPIMMTYSYVAQTAANPGTNVSVVGIAASSPSGGPYMGVIPYNLPITPGTAFLVLRVTGGGIVTYLDDGAGNFRVSLPAGTIVGSINYTTGAWSFTVAAVGTLVAFSAIQLGYTGPSTSLTIMGINQWNDEANNSFQLVVEDTRRASWYNNATFTFESIADVAETLFIVPTNAFTGTFDNAISGTSVIPPFGLIAPLSVVITVSNPLLANPIIETTTDDGSGGIVQGAKYIDNSPPNNSSINYLTGEIVLSVGNRNTLSKGWAINVTFTLQNDYFTGNQSNFFNWTNWDPPTNLIITQPANAEEPAQYEKGFLYLTNNVDPVTLYYGINHTLSRPAFAVQQKNLGLGLNEILRTLDVKVFDNRLLFCRPTTTISDGNPDPQDIRYSAQFQPTNFVADIPGSGGVVTFATSDWINCVKYLKDFLVIFMQNSTWSMRTTGNAFQPFIAYKINNTKNTSAPYGAIEYDDQITSMGTKGLIACDGNAVDRYDWKIIDQFDNIASQYFIQCFGQRFDILNQAWMLYPDISEDATLSNKVLLYNYVEDSWAKFNMPLSCLGIGFGIKDLTWADFAPGGFFGAAGLNWDQADFPWDNYLLQTDTLRLLGGDFVGNVLQLNDGPSDNGTPIFMNATTKKYNPFAKDGLKGQFGYIDVYFTVNPLITLTFNFFIDNNTDIAFTRSIALIGQSVNSAYGWQRIFINVQASQIQWQITDNGLTGFQILGQILWARPAGRITP